MKKKTMKLVNVHVGYGRFIMVAIPVTPKAKAKRAVATLRLEKLRTYGDFVNKMKLIRVDMRNNATSFPSPPITVVDSGILTLT